MKDFDLSSLTAVQVQGLMQGAVGPRPIAFASTINAKGEVNLSPFSFFNMFSSNPPILVFSPARRVRDNTLKHTLMNMQEIPEVCINVVDYALAGQCSLASTEYEAGINEFIKAGLTALPSDTIKPPRVKESPVHFECRVNQIIPLGNEGGAGHLVVCEVKKMHVREALLSGPFQIDQTKIDTVARMGGDWYCRANGSALFELEKPVRNKGIGIDQLPEQIRTSNYFTGNELASLGNVEQLPDALKLADFRQSTDFLNDWSDRCQEAKRRIAEGKATEALLVLMA